MGCRLVTCATRQGSQFTGQRTPQSAIEGRTPTTLHEAVAASENWAKKALNVELVRLIMHN